MATKGQGDKARPSAAAEDSKEPQMDIKSILILSYDMETKGGLGEQQRRFSRWKGPKEETATS